MPLGERGTAQQRLVRRHCVRALAQTGDRICEDGPPGGFGEPVDGAGRRVAAPADDDQPAGLSAHRIGDARHGRLVGRARRPSHGCPRTPVGPTRRVDERRARGHQRLPEREVEVHGAGGRPDGLGDRARGDRPPRRPCSGLIRGHADFAEPLHGPAVEIELVDGLAGAGVAQLGRAIGGADDQGRASVARLEHGGMEVGRCRPRGAEHDGRGSARLGGAEGEEGRRPLVEVHVEADAVVGGKGERERGRPRPRRHACLVHACPRPLVDQGASEGRGGVAGHARIRT